MTADIYLFLGSVAVISLSGVLSPGPITATAIAHGSRESSAGAFIALGHGAVELPLIVLLSVGAKAVFEAQWARVIIGLIGGGFLVHMGLGMLKSKLMEADRPSATRLESFIAGVVLSATNPYFLLWWLSVGLGLLISAEAFGIMGVIAFAAVHWACDLVWLWMLSYMAGQGVKAFGEGFYRKVSLACGWAVIVFGGMFIYKAIGLVLEV